MSMLEQAHKILLEEMAKTPSGNSLSRYDIIDRVGGVTYRDMGGVNRNMGGVKLSGMETDHILRRITVVEDQLDSLLVRLDQLDTFRPTRDTPGDLRRSIEDLEKRYVGLDRALSRYRDDVSVRGGAEAIVDLQKGFREVEHVVRNLVGVATLGIM